MAKKKNKALDKRNFDENKSESDGNEIKQSNDPGLGRMPAMAMQCQRQDEKCQNRQNGLDHVPGFQGEKEKWCAIVYRCNVVRVISDVLIASAVLKPRMSGKNL